MTSITSTAQWSIRINQVIFAVLDVSWTMGFNSDKKSKVFCIINNNKRVCYCRNMAELAKHPPGVYGVHGHDPTYESMHVGTTQCHNT